MKKNLKSNYSFATLVVFIYLLVRCFAYLLHGELNSLFSIYETAGINFLHGNGFSSNYKEELVPLTAYPPGYSFIIACIYFFFGINPLSIVIIQCLFGLVAILFFYKAIESLSGESLAKKTTLFLVLCPVFWSNDIDINTGSAFAIDLTLIAFAFLVKAIQSQKVRYFIFAGLVGAGAITVRSEYAVFPMAFLIILFIRKVNIFKMVLFVLSVVIVLLPLSIRNYSNFNKISPLPGGLGLAMVNVIGKFYPDTINQFAFGDQNILNVEKGDYNQLYYPFPYEREKNRLERSLKFVRENPGKYVKVLLLNIPRAWFGLKLNLFPQKNNRGLQMYLSKNGNLFGYLRSDIFGFIDKLIGFVISVLLFSGMLLYIVKTKCFRLKESYILIPVIIAFLVFLPIGVLGKYILVAYYFMTPISIIGYSKLFSKHNDK